LSAVPPTAIAVSSLDNSVNTAEMYQKRYDCRKNPIKGHCDKARLRRELLDGIMRQEIADLAARGCTYLQMDEVPLAVICDKKTWKLYVRGATIPMSSLTFTSMRSTTRS
jgi:hypothetical protein